MLTAVIITKNEEKMIKDCLKSIQFADEIIVVDCQSSDNTAAIAKKEGAKVINHHFIDFATLRNYPLKDVKTPWVLYIDADERVSDTLQKEIKKAINTSPRESAFYLQRKNFYLGKKWPGTEKIIRLFKTKDLIKWSGPVHESPQFTGTSGLLKGELIHYTHRSIEEMIDKTIIWSDIEAHLRLKANHPKVTWWRLIRVFMTGFFNSYIRQKGFTVGAIGLIESIYQGYSMFITYVRLWELQNKKKLR